MNKIRVIQFPHPGNEYKYSKEEKNCGIKKWNAGSCHSRNFIKAYGRYIDSSNQPKNGILSFWGEWEPPATATKLDKTSGTDMPLYLIEPNLSLSSSEIGMNTDPLVFGSCFKYAICRQKSKNGILKNLEPGSIILFGCIRRDSFLLDTVFVTGEKRIPFNLQNPSALKEINEYEQYKRIVLDTFNKEKSSCACTPYKKNVSSCIPQDDNTNIYYEGVKYDSPINGMYSFVPARIFEDGNTGFERLVLNTTDFPEIKERCSRNFCTILESSGTDSIKSFWNRLSDATLKNSLVKAIEFPYPKSL